HHHWPRTLLRERITSMVFADAHEQAAFGDRRYQVTVQHEADPAEHFDFSDGACAHKRSTHARGEVLVKGHAVPPLEEVTRRDRLRAVNIEDSALVLDTTKLGHWGRLFLDDLTPVIRAR